MALRLFATLTLLFLSFAGLKLQAQDFYVLSIKPTNNNERKIISGIDYRKKFVSDSLRQKEVNEFMLKLQALGYINARVDSVMKDEGKETLFVSLHEAYKWEHLGTGNLKDYVINDIGFREKDFKGRSFNYSRLIDIEEKIIDYYENHGYPFASVRLDSIEIRKGRISAAIQLEEGPLIKIDTIILQGFTKIHPKYINRLIDIRPGDFYQESKIKQIDRQLSTMGFATISGPTQISFRQNDAQIHIKLQKRTVNIFDGILGFQPNTGTENKLVLTGNLRLKLINSFKRGELIDLNWQSPQGASQNLYLHFAYPYLFNSPIGIDYEFKLLKQDSTFVNVRNKPGLLFLINGLDYIKISGDFYSSSTLESQSSNLPKNPAILDFKSQIFNLEVNFKRLDYIFNPRSGWAARLSGGYGARNIIRQYNISDSFYDSIPLKTNQLKLSLQLQYFIPLFRRQTLLLSNKSALLDGSYLLENELFRIGGFSDLRGFDEISIYASTYSIFTIEWRMLLEKNSYINVFWNGAYVENKHRDIKNYDQPMGFGAGISFETKAGILNLSYAVGRQQGNPFEFNKSKVHFGYTARF